MIAEITEKMIEFYRGDIRRINHFMKVYGYASMIGRLESLEKNSVFCRSRYTVFFVWQKLHQNVKV